MPSHFFFMSRPATPRSAPLRPADVTRSLTIGFLALLGLATGCGTGEDSLSQSTRSGNKARLENDGSSGQTTARTDLSSANTRHLTNVSYDPTRELYAEFNEAFAAYWLEKQGEKVEIAQSHGGSGKQSRAVIEGLDADVVSLALSGDIDAIADKAEALPKDWQERLPNNSSPYTSTIVFLVRKGNPKKIKDWDDLIREGVEVITPNPKTGGGARWNYLAAWGYALQRELNGGSTNSSDTELKTIKEFRAATPADKKQAAEEAAKQFIAKLYKNVPILDTSARAATNTFLQRSIGDVLITWENEAFLAMRELGTDQVELIVPSLSILAEPPVAVVDRNAKSHGTEDLAKAYLEYLYSEVGQKIAAKHYYRPRVRDGIPAEVLSSFADVKLFELTDIVADWKEAQEFHFKERTGVFDQVYSSESK